MFSEIVMPKDNEGEFVEIALKLGIKKLYFLYDFDDFNQEVTQKKLDSTNNQHVGIEIGFIVNQKNLNKAFQQSRLLIARSSDKDRFFIESKKIKMIYGLEEVHKKDYLHQRMSGLNHVLCEVAKKNNVIIGFSYSSLLGKSGPATALLIGRMMQNIALCQKYKVKIIPASFTSEPSKLRSQHDVSGLFRLLGI